MMKALSSSETSANCYQTTQFNISKTVTSSFIRFLFIVIYKYRRQRRITGRKRLRKRRENRRRNALSTDPYSRSSWISRQLIVRTNAWARNRSSTA
jgi:hypothetical protein